MAATYFWITAFPPPPETVPKTQLGAAAVAKQTAAVRSRSGLPAVTRLQVVEPPTADRVAQGKGPSPGATGLVVVRMNATGATPSTAPAGAAPTARFQVALPVIVALPVTA